MKIPEKVDERLIYENPWRKILEKDYKEKDGNTYTFLTVGCTGTKKGTMILALTESEKIILLREFRVGIEDIVYNFPVGIHEPGISAEENCNKELEEESGYSSQNFQYIGETILESYNDGRVAYYFAKNCKAGTEKPEAQENIETLLVRKDEFENMLVDGTINCPLTISCYTFAKARNLI